MEDSLTLGPLPPKWEKAYTESGEVYFIDHNSGTSHWLDPRLSKFQKKTLEDCTDDELPYGWEKISDPQYGTYFIDHVNRRTQYENPVIQAKRAAELSDVPVQRSSSSFTRNPAELCGERFTTTLLKSSRGLGFTIVGGDDNFDEFLQIKSIVPNGPAWLDAKLQTGDLLVYVNDICVLGFKHHEMVSVFQSISPGETVVLEVCRGYPLPFDPNDPNTEVITTVAVDAPDKNIMYMDLNIDGNYNLIDTSNNSLKQNISIKNQSRSSILNDTFENISKNQVSDIKLDKLDILSIFIVKGAMGFGFTIADSAYGQKVKKILDRQRCKNLMEGDILLEINEININEMSHGEVVQVLKDCPRNHEASVKVQRGGTLNSSNNALKSKHRKSFDNNSSVKETACGLFRSKTPTADLYSTQPKEVLPTRPKTPLVDTRIRTKTPIIDIESIGHKDRERNTKPKTTQQLDRNEASGMTFVDSYSNKVSNLSDSMSNTNIRDTNFDKKLIQDNNLAFNRELVCSQTDLNEPYLPQEYYSYSNLHNGNLTGHHDSCYCSDCKEYKLDYNINNISHDMIGTMENDYTDRRKVSTSFEHGEPHQSRLPNNWNCIEFTNSKQHLPGGYVRDVETLVTLARQENGFGFRIVGGTEEGSQVAIGHIVAGGAADLDNRICMGDEILSVDGQSVRNTSHHQVVQLMGVASQNGCVTLGLRRRTGMLPPQEVVSYPYDVVVHRTENEGFGFVIISSVNKAGSTIGRLIEGSPAELCGQLHVGDRILAVNNMDISHLSHVDIVNLIKESGYSVTLTIGLPFDTNKPMLSQPVLS